MKACARWLLDEGIEHGPVFGAGEDLAFIICVTPPRRVDDQFHWNRSQERKPVLLGAGRNGVGERLDPREERLVGRVPQSPQWSHAIPAWPRRSCQLPALWTGPRGGGRADLRKGRAARSGRPCTRRSPLDGGRHEAGPSAGDPARPENDSLRSLDALVQQGNEGIAHAHEPVLGPVARILVLRHPGPLLPKALWRNDEAAFVSLGGVGRMELLAVDLEVAIGDPLQRCRELLVLIQVSGLKVLQVHL